MTRNRAPKAPAPDVQVTVSRGQISDDTREYAARKIGHVASYSHEPVLFAHVVLELASDPARGRPATAEATLDVNGTPIRAGVEAETPREAVDQLEDRLRRQLVEHEERLHPHRG